MRLIKIISASDADNLKRWLAEFEKRAKRRKEVFNPEEVSRDIKRWQSEMRKKNKNIQKNILNYATPQDLHKAMAGFSTKEEIQENYLELAEFGTKPPIWEKDNYKLFEVTNAEALSFYSNQNTHWCTKDVDAADEALNERGRTFIFQKVQIIPRSLAAIF